MNQLSAVEIEYGEARVSSRSLSERHALENSEGIKDVRVVPLLISQMQNDDQRVIGVGHCMVIQTRTDELQLKIVLVDSWILHGSFHGPNGKTAEVKSFRHVDESGVAIDVDLIKGLISDTLRKDVEAELQATGEYAVPKIAKFLCERSRNTLAQIRDLRYKFETDLAQASQRTSGSESYTQIVAHLLQLNVVCGRVSDQAREAIREGLWVYICDREVYHSYRKLQDPTIISDFRPATFGLRPWMRVHDAAIRQSTQLQLQTDAETISIQSLISSATGISSSREADAQSRFNLLLGLLSIGLGVPALFLALYGATKILPLNDFNRIAVFSPVALPLILAAILAMAYAPKGPTRRIWRWCGIGTLAVCITMILAALAFPQ